MSFVNDARGLFGQGDFMIDPNTTPEMLKAKRERLAAMMPQYGKAQYVGEGLGQLFTGIGAGRQNKAMDKYEGEQRKGASEAYESMMRGGGGPLSILGMRDPGASYTPQPQTEADVLGDDVMGALGKPSQDGIGPKIVETAAALGMDPVDLATIISYETAGTFDPTKAGPTTQWGQHKGLIQFGEPQAQQYGVDWNNPEASQLGADGAVAKYFKANGWQPGMGMMDAYSIVNAGGPGRYGASDANNGGAPGTVADKVNNQMAAHRAKAQAMLGGTYAPKGGNGGNSQPTPTRASGGPDLQSLMQAAANPWLTPEQRGVINGMIQQAQSQQQAADDRYWKQQDPAYQQNLQLGQIQLEQARNPKVETQFIKGIGLVNSQTGAVVNDFGGTGGGTADGTEYGLTPQYGVDANGNPVLIQLGKNGTATQTPLPEGVSLSKEPIKMDAGTHFVLLDPITRQPVGTIPKDNRGAASETAIGSVTGKAAGENIAAAGSDMQAAQNALDLIQSLRDDPDRTRGTGTSAMLNSVPGTRGFNYQQKVEQAKGGAFLSAIQQMRGLGALSNNEGSAATAAVTRMNTAMTEDAFLAALDDYEKIVNQGLEKARALQSGGAAPATSAQKRLKFNPATGKLE